MVTSLIGAACGEVEVEGERDKVEVEGERDKVEGTQENAEGRC